ncbi:LexA family protein [Legionella sp. W05-934-2]|uniref:LexA family protein n=1 Tax=Legionella sp. W05-934-2 TaxID=1198649 RepID=UPI0034632BAF
MNVKEQIGRRIKEERNAKGLTRKELAALTEDLNVSRINNYERGDRTPGPSAIKQLAEALEVSPAFLMCLSDDKQGSLHKRAGIGALVPILDYQQACEPIYHIDAFRNEDNSEKFDLIPIDPNLANRLSENAFAIKIKDDSMSPEFRTDDMIIVDPEKKATPGDFVVFHIENEDEVIIRKYKQISAGKNTEFELVALSDDWANIHIDNETEGRVVGTAMSLKRDFK